MLSFISEIKDQQTAKFPNQGERLSSHQKYVGVVITASLVIKQKNTHEILTVFH
jgi:hypothetical protein